jgi:hypothetical protein
MKFLSFFIFFLLILGFESLSSKEEDVIQKKRQQEFQQKDSKSLSKKLYGGFYKDNARIVLIERNSTTGNKIDLNLNKIIQFKNLEISLVACWESEKDRKDHIALVFIEEFFNVDDQISKVIEKNRNKKLSKPSEDDKSGKSKILYYGWIFSKHKYINNIKHAIFDLWLDHCF